MDTAETHPDSLTGSLDSKRLLGLLWIHPRIAFTRLESPWLTLGREEGCSVILHGNSVSRVHARIEARGPLWVVSDGGSKNGTRHNGQLIGEAPLADNDVLRLGEHVAVAVKLEADASQSSPIFQEPIPGMLVGPRSRSLWRRMSELAPSKLPIILEGATGTGKEVFAKALHVQSQRSGEFVALNCAAVPEALAESQLFGHVRGAFTGAAQSAPGVLEASNGGTLLLDEIVDLPEQVQAKLLRALEESQVTRVGETKPRCLDLRIVAATQVPLAALVETERFRGDLFARLAGGTLRLLPLNKRREEVPALYRKFLAQAGREAQPLSPGFVEALCLQDWPFNTRQLAQLAAQTALAFAPNERLRSSNLHDLLARVYGDSQAVCETPRAPDAGHPEPVAVPPKSLSLLGGRRAAWFERHQKELDALLRELERNRGNVSRAAKAVGISRQQANRLLTAHTTITGRAGQFTS